MLKSLAVFPITEHGYLLARCITERFPDAVIYRPAELRSGRLKSLVAEAFKSCGGLFFISAAAIAVRTCAPLLKGKEVDPAVVVMDDSGRFVISLLSGHLGGANGLAKAIADIYGALPVITTATDGAGLPCIEDVSSRLNLKIEDVKKIKLVNSALLKAARVFVIDANVRRRKEGMQAFGQSGVFTFRRNIPALIMQGDVFAVVTPFIGGVPEALRRRSLVLCPAEFVAGVGCRRGVSAKEIGLAVRAALKEAGVSLAALRNLASVDIKQDEAGLVGFARQTGLEISFYTGERLNKVKVPSGGSEMVMKVAGTGSVSEAAAILSAGAKRLWLRKIKHKRVTVALARVASAS